MSVLDVFLGLDLVELKAMTRQLVADPHITESVTFHRAGQGVISGTTGMVSVEDATRTLKTISGPAVNALTGEFETGTKTFLVLREQFQVPLPSITPARGDWITDADGANWRIEGVDKGDLGKAYYYVLKAQAM